MVSPSTLSPGGARTCRTVHGCHRSPTSTRFAAGCTASPSIRHRSPRSPPRWASALSASPGRSIAHCLIRRSRFTEARAERSSAEVPSSGVPQACTPTWAGSSFGDHAKSAPGDSHRAAEARQGTRPRSLDSARPRDVRARGAKPQKQTVKSTRLRSSNQRDSTSDRCVEYAQARGAGPGNLQLHVPSAHDVRRRMGSHTGRGDGPRCRTGHLRVAPHVWGGYAIRVPALRLEGAPMSPSDYCTFRRSRAAPLRAAATWSAGATTGRQESATSRLLTLPRGGCRPRTRRTSGRPKPKRIIQILAPAMGLGRHGPAVPRVAPDVWLERSVSIMGAYSEARLRVAGACAGTRRAR